VSGPDSQTVLVPNEQDPRDAHGHSLARSERLLLDELSSRLETLQIFRQDDEQRANAILEQFGAQGRVESEMLAQLGATKPLQYPDRFEEAHRTAMRALEVFDRNGARPPSGLRVGALTPIASFFVQQLIRIVTRSYQKTVIERIRELYARREANSVRGSAEFQILGVARAQVERLAPGFNKGGGGIPAFLLGGAVLSGFTSILREATRNAAVLLVLGAVAALLALASFWCVRSAAAIARRRTRIALDAPLRALWETIGAAGDPPRDSSRQFATYAAILLVLAWIILPIVVPLAIQIR